jgi:dUTP pyrophosphatase
MKYNVIKFKKLTPSATLPKAITEGDIGFDICSAETVEIYPGQTKKISTGLQLADMPTSIGGTSIFMKVEGRSGLASRGIFPIGGIIDPNYRGEIGIVLHNASESPFCPKQGDRIAQLVVYNIQSAANVSFEESEEVTETERGAAGFGSTGLKQV